MEMFTYELLAKKHGKADFDCGVPALNTYLHRYAAQDSRERFTRCYVASTDINTVAGFYTLSSSAIDISLLPESITRKLPRYPSVPAVLLGRLAVDVQYTGIGLGGSLLVDAILNAARSTTGIWAMIVDAKDEQAKAFYLKYGFISFKHNSDALYLPLTNTLLKDLASFDIR